MGLHTRSEVSVGACVSYWSQVHTVRPRHSRSEVVVLAFDSNCELESHCFRARHTRSEVEVGARTSNSVAPQICCVVHCLFEVSVQGTTSNSDEEHSVQVPHCRGACDVGGVTSYCDKKWQVGCAPHTLLEVRVGASSSYSAVEWHVVSEVQPRSELGVGGFDSNWVAVHTVSALP